MAFEQKTWTDRVAEFINRRTLTKEDGTEEIVTVARNEGSISVEGDAFNAENMNDLEQRIASAISECFQAVSEFKAAVATALTNKGVATASDATKETMAANVEKVASNHYASGVANTKKGTATTAHVLAGTTFTSANGVGLSGAMPNRGAWTGATTGSGNVAIPAGYHNGSGYVSGAGAYNAGVAAADARANANSVNYKTGYNAGYAAGVKAEQSAVSNPVISKYSDTNIQIQLSTISGFNYSGSDGYFIDGSYKGILSSGYHAATEYSGTYIQIGGGTITLYPKK